MNLHFSVIYAIISLNYWGDKMSDVIIKLVNKQSLTEKERFQFLNSKHVNAEITEYLSSRFSNLYIEICEDYEGNILYLMKRSLLEGWCWQTTESAIIFLNDEDYIERGNLKFEKYKDYYHSWICFQFDKEEYVFDPCLNLLCKKRWYYKIFEIEVKGKSTAKEVRDDLIHQIQNPKPIDNSESAKRRRKLMEEFFGDALDKQRKGTHISGDDDVNSPMYRNNTGYKATIENGKVKSLVAHYYKNY